MTLLKCKFAVIYHVLTHIYFAVSHASFIDDRFRLLYSKEMMCNHSRSLNLNVNDTKIYFYDFINEVNVSSLINTAPQVIENSTNLDFKRRLIVFVPGYKSHIERDVEESIRHTFKHVRNVYLIIVDHSTYTYEDDEKFKSYLRSVLYSYYIGAALGTFLSDLSNLGFPPDGIHGVGLSLGGHIMGYAADVYRIITNESISRVTGLDPAGPCFSGSAIEHVRSGVAKYVEVYHCNAGHFGTTRILGDTDFFFNFEGKIQPDCDKGTEIEETAKCYHKACVKYWTKTVRNHKLYIATSCSTYEAYAAGLCDDNQKTLAGYFNPGDAKGNYYVSTETVS